MVNVMTNDELKIYRGEDFVISKYIRLHQPSLAEICDYGEQEYYSMLYQLTATPQSMKVQLWDIMEIDYTTITPYELFWKLICKMYPQEKTSIIFGDLDLTKFEITQRKDDQSVLLYQVINDEKVTMDEFTYNMIMDYLRQVHSIHKDEKMPANETTKMILIEDEREEYARNKNKEHHSYLKNLISTIVGNSNYNHQTIWNVKINAFMDSVKRFSKIKNADLLLQSGYSGFGVNLKEISENKLDYFGELD